MGGNRDDDGNFRQKQHARRSSVDHGATQGDLASQLAYGPTVGKHTLMEGIAAGYSVADAIAFFDSVAGEARAQMAALAQALVRRDRLLAVTAADQIRICLTTARRHLEHIPPAGLVDRRQLLAELEAWGQAAILGAREAGILEAAPAVASGNPPRIVAAMGKLEAAFAAGEPGSSIGPWSAVAGEVQRSSDGPAPPAEQAHRRDSDGRVTGPLSPHGLDPDRSPQHAAAAEGIAGAGAPLPHLDLIQRSFGRHDVTGIRAHVGGAATQAARALGATAYAAGNSVAFAAPPDLHTAAHEAAHVMQQRAGVVLAGGIGAAGDRYEQHADAVADRVVAGASAEPLLDVMIGANAGASPSSFAIQRKEDPSAAKLSGDHEKVLLAAVRRPVRDGDPVGAWERFDMFVSWLPRLSPADRQILLIRLEKPAAGDELARSFHDLFHPEWRNRSLRILRSGGDTAAASASQAGSGRADPAARSLPAAAAAPAVPWEHMFGAASTPVNKLGRVQAREWPGDDIG